MSPSQAVQQPFGVTVFGSAVVRVEPDIASLTFAVARLAQQPADAFQQAREAVQAAHTYLVQAHITDVASSHIRLSQSFRYTGGEQRFEGYMAKVSFTVLLRDLDRLEEITSGIIAAGVNEIDAAEFQTARLREIRTEARQRAIAAAREKAEVYCSAADVHLGAVLHIEDVNPEVLRGSSEGHVMREAQPADDDGPMRAFNPGSIVVGAAVLVSFSFRSDK